MLIRDSAEALRVSINGALVNREPWQVVAITTTSVLSAVWLWNLVFNQDENLYQRLKKRIFKLSRGIPAVQAKIDEELTKLKKDFENDMLKNCGDLAYTTKLPFDGLKVAQVLKKVEEHTNLGQYDYNDGRVSGAVYTINPEVIALVKEVYGRCSYTNPLHADLFPGINKMEAEVVKMLANLFHGSPEACGSVSFLDFFVPFPFVSLEVPSVYCY